MRYAARVDVCHSQVAQAFENCGWDVFDAKRMGQGFPDLLVHRNGRLVLIEVKAPNGKLRTSQVLSGVGSC